MWSSCLPYLYACVEEGQGDWCQDGWVLSALSSHVSRLYATPSRILVSRWSFRAIWSSCLMYLYACVEEGQGDCSKRARAHWRRNPGQKYFKILDWLWDHGLGGHAAPFAFFLLVAGLLVCWFCFRSTFSFCFWVSWVVALLSSVWGSFSIRRLQRHCSFTPLWTLNVEQRPPAGGALQKYVWFVYQRLVNHAWTSSFHLFMYHMFIYLLMELVNTYVWWWHRHSIVCVVAY